MASRVGQSEAVVAGTEERGDTLAQSPQEEVRVPQDTLPAPVEIKEEKRDSLAAGKPEGEPSRRDTLAPSVGRDSTFLSRDSVAMDSTGAVVPQDSLQQDSVPPPLFNDVVTYTAKDSIKLSVPTKEMFLYKEGYVKYINTELTADSIAMNMATNIIFATGMVDSVGGLSGKPIFKDSGQEYESVSMKYNFKTEKGYIKNVITQQGEGYVQARLTKKMDESRRALHDL